MQKRAYLIKLLQQLQDDWPIAQWLLLVLENTNQDDKMVDTLLQLLVDAMETTQVQVAKGKLDQTKHIIEKIQKMEQEEHEQELAEIDQLLEQL